MSTHTVCHFWITLIAIGLAGSSVISSQYVSCPCGSTGQNYTHCFDDALDKQQTCETWANCQTCLANSTLCSSCPLDRFGPSCSEVCGQIPHHTNLRRSPSPAAGDWPWSMGIALSNQGIDNLFCAGVILDKNTVLTAAQCVVEVQNIVLLFGTVRFTAAGYSFSEQKRRISRIVLHPDFDNETKANDIALLKFEPGLNFSQTVQPLCLPGLNFSDRYLLPGAEGVIPGWGYNYTMYMFIAAENYEVANVSVQPDDGCVEACQQHGLFSCSTPKTFCADYPKGVDGCLYRGAPMVIHAEERYILAGLVTRKLASNERKCRRGEITTVLTNVSHFMPFILQNLS